MPQLQVMVGSDRFHLEPCRLNDTQRPHEIDNEYFIGRVLVRILDAPGAREGEPGREYFQGRSRKFSVQIEGRFKQRWNGDEIQFGTDFDHLVDFPRAPFNAGMRVARLIDPCTFYDIQPPSGRPFIMSPYVACMNTVCAWPAPSRAHDAVVVLRHTHHSDSPHASRPASPLIEPEKGHGDPHAALAASPAATDDEEEGDIVPAEKLQHSHSQGAEDRDAAAKKKKKGWLSSFASGGSGSSAHKEERVLKRYWRFVGFREEPRVRALLEAHHAKLKDGSDRSPTSQQQQQRQHPEEERQRHLSVSSATSARTSTEVQHAPARQTLSRLGTGFRTELGRSSDRPETQNHYDGDDPVMPVSPRIGANELATAPPEDGGSAAAEASSSTKPALALEGLGESGLGLGAPVTSSPASRAETIPSGSSSHSNSKASSTPASSVDVVDNSAEAKRPMPELKRITTDIRQEMAASAKSDGLRDGDFKLADTLHHTHLTSPRPSSAAGSQATLSAKHEEALGPWRFEDSGTDMVEDNAFIFTTQSLPVPKRRKHFANEKNRIAFQYDPDVVYGASFFSDAFDFNTFNIGIGPVRLNVQRFFQTMPIRYTLRSATDEEKCMATISFQLV